jgi:hypothetical protein
MNLLDALVALAIPGFVADSVATRSTAHCFSLHDPSSSGNKNIGFFHASTCLQQAFGSVVHYFSDYNPKRTCPPYWVDLRVVLRTFVLIRINAAQGVMAFR